MNREHRLIPENELFEAEATPEDLSRALSGARSAVLENRCHLPVQGSILIPSLLRRFAAEFEEPLTAPAQATGPVLVPRIADFDEVPRTSSFDIRLPLRSPDWTFRSVLGDTKVVTGTDP